MARRYETVTIESATETPIEILQLKSPDTALLSAGLETWEYPSSAGTVEGMDLGISVGDVSASPGGMNFNHDLSFEPDGAFLEGMAAIPFTPSYDLDAFSTTFEDPFSYQSESFSMFTSSMPEPRPTNLDLEAVESKDEKPDNKLLSFKPPTSSYAIFTAGGAQIWPTMTAELYGMFFVAEDVFGDNVPTPGRPTELTCYRRNLFQISGNITIPRSVKSVITEQGVQLPVFDLSATLTAVESIDGKATEIISVPWKSTLQTSATASAEEKSGSAPQRIPLDLSSSPELDPAVVSMPIAWKRLQFKHATANNGRRKGLQQHYIVHIALEGVLGNGETVKLADIESGPVIVRGRSPRNFDTRKDVSLSSERKIDHKPKQSDASKEVPVKVDPSVPNGNQRFYSATSVQTPLDISDWGMTTPAPPLSSPALPNETHRSKKPTVPHSNSASSNNTQRPPIPRARWNSDSTPPKPNRTSSFLQQRQQPRTTPIDLSIAEEDQTTGRGSFSHSGRKLSLGGSPRSERASSGSSGVAGGKVPAKKSIGSPVEDADLLYEYFPLSLDDWMPPVDAIYRPHVVHHTIVPPDLKAEQIKNKNKRYFTADD